MLTKEYFKIIANILRHFAIDTKKISLYSCDFAGSSTNYFIGLFRLYFLC